ncbi:hypothetical protein [Marivita hallyeonensis]|uniref:Uncharacterized protein n=1 Tax=Marivita hallyeonensis TaxID=996342 RepID=A0A1M5W847_9RHOB|nr:hypothetical protein [Marivita hallyeonensis]SHH83657.1 hypothetical protein SAMN05443551_3309 [Marivita hallyeonensis]
MIRAAVLCLLLPQIAFAGEMRPVSFDSLRSLPHRIETFDTVPRTPEPGIAFDYHWRAPGLSVAERLLGQNAVVTETAHGRFDRLAGHPSAPPQVTSGQPGHNLTIAYHEGFQSNALFPLGPAGFASADGRGEGSMALAFDDPQFAFGFRLHAEYPDPLGQRPEPHTAQVTFYDADARLLARVTLGLTHGVMSLGWRNDDGVAAVTIETTDPGGIAIDDILFAVKDLSG